MKLSNKRKTFLARILNTTYAMSALSSAYSENDGKLFKEDYGITMKQGEEALDALVEFLKK